MGSHFIITLILISPSIPNFFNTGMHTFIKLSMDESILSFVIPDKLMLKLLFPNKANIVKYSK